jgi:aryl-phospho-beta-D-glucosidase BglC (GH1 family)
MQSTAAPAATTPAATRNADMPWLHARGTDIVDATGKVVVLRGFNFGGALVMEPWLANLDLNPGATGLPPIKDDKGLWEVISQRFGPEKTAELQRTWRTAWANESDIARLAALGANVVRIPFWYPVVEDPKKPGELRPDGIKVLDELVDACAAHRVYAILDLHGAPGAQSKEDHTGEAGRNEFFRSPDLQARTARLWTNLARHFRDRPEVAGYDLLNEPMGAPDAAVVLAVHDRLYKAVRAADDRHIVIIEDGYKGDAAFPPNPAAKGWRNVCFSKHHYKWDAKGIDDHRRAIAQDLPKLRQQQQKWNVPLYIGEFSTVTEKGGGIPAMAEYFAAFNKYGWSWTPWTWKQVGGPTRNNTWSPYSNDKSWDRANPYTDSFETLMTKFANYDVSKLAPQEAYLKAFKEAVPTKVPGGGR